MVIVMEKIPPDCWDAFPLFQVLNDYLVTEGEFYLQFYIKQVAKFILG